MKKYTLKRILTSLFTLLAILLVLFILMQLMPGSPFNDEKLTVNMESEILGSTLEPKMSLAENSMGNQRNLKPKV